MRDFNENTATDGVLKSFQTIKNQRLKELMGSIVSHLHMVVKETEPTFEDLTKISSIDKSFGCCFMSVIS